MDEEIFENARQARDPRFDGRFFVGVRTTGVYCRPVCPVKLPRKENVTFFPSAAAAAEAGYRPCLRCRPEASPGTPAWLGTSTTVTRALRMIADGVLDDDGLDAMCDRLGITSRHLGRLFIQHLGASPKAVAQTRRLHFAKKLLDETDLPMIDIAYSSGYGSVRRFNDHFKQVYGQAPSRLRKNRTASTGGLTIRLGYRPPYDYDSVLQFLAMRATPGIECVEDGRYSRTVDVEGQPGSFSVRNDVERRELICDIDVAGPRALTRVVGGIRRIFDLDADPLEINCRLAKEPLLAKLVKENPGQRVPGAWDVFEIIVRAIVGQQVSVKGATTVMGRIVDEYGGQANGKKLFPAPEVMAALDPGKMSMPGARAETIRQVSRAIVSGDIDVSANNSTEGLVEQLVSIKGIGLWTAQYVAMRALGDPDAFLHSDLVIKRAAREHLNIESEKALLAYSEQWRPWRAYACLHLWRKMTQKGD